MLAERFRKRFTTLNRGNDVVDDVAHALVFGLLTDGMKALRKRQACPNQCCELPSEDHSVFSSDATAKLCEKRLRLVDTP